MLNVFVPRTDPMEYPSRERDRFHEELAKRISRELIPLFGMFVYFPPE
jgi:hypothetical protein